MGCWPLLLQKGEPLNQTLFLVHRMYLLYIAPPIHEELSIHAMIYPRVTHPYMSGEGAGISNYYIGIGRL